MNAEHINPFLQATVEVFSTMLGSELSRGELSLNARFHPEHDISGVIGLSGDATGTVIVSVDTDVALSAARAMLGEKPTEVNADVIDAVGELTNMIAGKSKSLLEHLDLTLALPTVITGKGHQISFASGARTLCIPYTCDWGEMSVEVGLVVNKTDKSTSQATNVGCAL